MNRERPGKNREAEKTRRKQTKGKEKKEGRTKRINSRKTERKTKNLTGKQEGRLKSDPPPRPTPIHGEMDVGALELDLRLLDVLSAACS